jgi:hypothetical protein
MNPNAISSLFHFDFEAIIADPARLGAFLELAEMIAELEPRAREAAITFGLERKEIPGWQVVRKEGNRFVEAAHVRELLQECPAKHLPAVLEVIAKALGNVGEKRWLSLCEVVGRLDGERVVSHAGATAFLAQGRE